MGRWVAAVLLALLLGTPPAAAAEPPPFVRPGARDRCPVCGMFVEKFPEWWSQAVFSDGTRATFDGVKDLVRFLRDPKRYAAGKPAAVTNLWVLDYYSVAPLPAESAWYVAGSDVLGPMGREFIPFRSRAEAEEFARDHRGESILRFDELPAYRLE